MFSELFALLTVYLVIVCTKGESDAKRNVAFVIDDTASMSNEIRQVLDQTEQIFNLIYGSKTSLIGDFILITFNDIEEYYRGVFFDNPHRKAILVRAITSDYKVFKEKLNAIKASGGGNCPEMCIEGIKTAVEKSNPNSHVFVFTDASAKDYKLGKIVEELALQKSIQITFLLTGICEGKAKSPEYTVYKNLAKATSGEVFELTKTDINEILKYIIHSMTSPKSPLLSIGLKPGINTFKIPTDPGMKDLTIKVNVKQNSEVTLAVAGPDNKEMPGNTMVNLPNTKIYAIQNPGNGHLVATVDAGSPGEASVKATVTVDFEHGFSILQPNSLKSTETSPVPDEESHLAIQLKSTGDIDPKLKSIQILDKDDKELMSMTANVTNESDKFYVTAHFRPPSDIFKIAITVVDTKTGNEFKRVAHNPTKVQPRPTGTLEYKRPQVKIEKSPKITVEYGDSIILPCKVIGYPKPNIVWQDKETGKELPSEAAILKLPDEFISNLKIENFNRTGSYKCKATSESGDIVTDSIEVETFRKRFLNILERPKDTNIDYKQTGDVYCKIDAWPTVNVAWYKNDKELANDVDFMISDDKSRLTVNNMRPELEGTYFCKATNDDNSINLKFTIKLSGVEPPIIDKIKPTITVTKGSKTGVPCSIIKGSPTPTITWEFKQHDANKFISLASTEQVIQLDQAEFDLAGTYKCHAKNIIGEDFFEILVIVQSIPKIEKSKSNVIADQGSKVIIPCRVIEGIPTPEITWEFKRKDTTDFQSISGTKEEEQIDSADVENAGVYRCRAKNIIGEDSHETELVVQYGPIIDKTEVSKIVKEGSKADIPCRILRGFPTPVIKWEFKKKNSNQFITLAGTEQMIHINTVTLQNAGVYKCVAKNFIGKDHYEFVLDVHCLPVLDKSKSIKYVKQGSNIIISCRITKGVPGPDITWEFKAEGAKDFVSLPETEKDLNIPTVDLENAGVYRCVAKNIIGKDSHDIKLIVQHVPVIDKSTKVNIAVEGSKATLKCRILKGYPPPRITWEFRRKSASEFINLSENGPQINIIPVELDSAGIYKCHAKNTVGQATHETELIVQNAPSVVVNPPVTVEIGKIVTLSCEVSGYPDPVVRWTKDGTIIVANPKYQIFKDNSLRFKSSIADRGNYTCEAKNTAGSDSKNTTLDIFGPVTIKLPFESKIITDVGSDEELYCKASGIPTPNITWSFISMNPKVLPSFPAQEILTLKRIQADSAGWYTCTADNGYDSKLITYELIVNVPVEIEHPLQTEFNAVEDDFIVMIPCKATGYPKPKIYWTKDFDVLPMGDTYEVHSDGTLIIKKPLTSTAGKYLCIADNDETNAFQLFTLNVTPFPINDGPTTTQYVEENTSPEIKCKLPHTSNDKIRWYKDGNRIPLIGNKYKLRGAAVSDSGLYSCRVSSYLGSQSAQVKVEVGVAPSFFSKKNSIVVVPFSHGREVTIECHVTGTPEPTITWWHNGEKLKESFKDYKFKMNQSHIGESRCEAKNNFGSVSRTFVIKITGCTINYAEKELNRYHPILFTNSGKLGEYQNQDGTVTIPEDDSVDVLCPNGVRQVYCSKKQFYTRTKLEETRYFQYADLKCDAEVELSISQIRTRIISCSNDPESRLFRVGYKKENTFSGVYDICMNKRIQKIYFVRHTLNRYASNIKLGSYPFNEQHMYYNYEVMFDCHKQKYDHNFKDGCCFLGRQMVAPEDVSPGIQQTTYININVLPEWNLCGANRNLNEINKRIRDLAKTIPHDLETYIGEFQNEKLALEDYSRNSKKTSKYIWKVIQVREVGQALAIVTINMPNLKQNEALDMVFCQDICDRVDWMQNIDLHDVSKGYTFCCQSHDFADKVNPDYKYLFQYNVLRNKNLN